MRHAKFKHHHAASKRRTSLWIRGKHLHYPSIVTHATSVSLTLLMAIISGAGAVEQITAVDVNTVEQAAEAVLSLSITDVKMVLNDTKSLGAAVLESFESMKSEALETARASKGPISY